MKASTFLVAALLILGIVAGSVYFLESGRPGTPATVEIELVTSQWKWEPRLIRGPPEAIATFVPLRDSPAFGNATILVRTGDKVILHIKSIDVAHGFAILGYESVRPVVIAPGEKVTVTFVADRPGTFIFYCTVFCGTGHPDHKGLLIVK